MTQALDDRQLLMRLARRAQRPSAPPAAASDYDFSAPACYTRQQLSQLAEPAAAAAAALGKALSGALRRELAVEYVGVSQHYWAPLSGRLRDGGAFCLPLASGNRLAGLVLMPAETAMGWVGAMLGGPAGDPTRQLSDLESALLADATAAVASGLASLTSSLKLTVRELVRGEAPLELAAADTLAALDFRAAGQEPWTLSLILPTDTMDSLAGCGVAATNPQELARDLQEHLGRVPVPAEVYVGSATIAMRDAISLEEGDVVVLSSQSGHGAELRIGGRVVALGTPAQTAGRYSLAVLQGPGELPAIE